MSFLFSSIKHLELPVSIKIHVTLPQLVYICMTDIYPNSISWTTFLLTW